jgi:hypothetical protein
VVAGDQLVAQPHEVRGRDLLAGAAEAMSQVVGHGGRRYGRAGGGTRADRAGAANA